MGAAKNIWGDRLPKAHEPNVEKAVDELLNALTTDGGHHKQYYAEKALIALVGPRVFNYYCGGLGIEHGTSD